MSLLLHPNATAEEGTMLTTLTAAAAAKAVEKVSGEETLIKWVNDVWMRGKKISGILTEGSASLEEGKLEYVIVGIGINIYEPVGGFPEEIKDAAGAVFTSHIQKENMRNRLASEFIKNFMEYYNMLPSRNYLEEYRNRCFVIGKEVKIVTPDGSVHKAGEELTEPVQPYLELMMPVICRCSIKMALLSFYPVEKSASRFNVFYFPFRKIRLAIPSTT